MLLIVETAKNLRRDYTALANTRLQNTPAPCSPVGTPQLCEGRAHIAVMMYARLSADSKDYTAPASARLKNTPAPCSPVGTPPTRGGVAHIAVMMYAV